WQGAEISFLSVPFLMTEPIRLEHRSGRREILLRKFRSGSPTFVSNAGSAYWFVRTRQFARRFATPQSWQQRLKALKPLPQSGANCQTSSTRFRSRLKTVRDVVYALRFAPQRIRKTSRTRLLTCNRNFRCVSANGSTGSSFWICLTSAEQVCLPTIQ